jgi:hypothetical protein
MQVLTCRKLGKKQAFFACIWCRLLGILKEVLRQIGANKPFQEDNGQSHLLFGISSGVGHVSLLAAKIKSDNTADSSSRTSARQRGTPVSPPAGPTTSPFFVQMAPISAVS